MRAVGLATQIPRGSPSLGLLLHFPRIAHSPGFRLPSPTADRHTGWNWHLAGLQMGQETGSEPGPEAVWGGGTSSKQLRYPDRKYLLEGSRRGRSEIRLANAIPHGLVWGDRTGAAERQSGQMLMLAGFSFGTQTGEAVCQTYALAP